MARMLAIWCPDWPVAAAGAPATEPLAVMDGGRVLACSAAAHAEGVRPGQRRRQAQERCPEVELIAHDPERDARAFEPVLVAVESLTPRIEVLRPGECVFPARGAARYHGGEVALTATILTAVDQVIGPLCRSQVGIANGRFPATLAARHAPGHGSSANAAGVVGPGSAHTDGVPNPGSDLADRQVAARGWIVPTEATLDFLAGFPVAVLERPELTDLLVRLGVFTLGDLAALPRVAMAARFGPEGARAHRLASGLDEHPRASRRPAPDLGVAMELDPPAMRVDVAAFAAKALADELVDRLERLGLACTRLRIEVETEHGETLARVWRHEPSARPSRRGAAADPRAVQVASIAERVRWQLDGWLTGSAATHPTGAITRLALVPDEAIAARGRQLGFWGEETEASQRAVRALARVQGLLGPEAVRRVSLRGGRAPADRVVSVAEGELPSTRDPSANGRPNAGRPPGAHGIPELRASTGGSATQGTSKARVQAAARSDAAARLDVPLRGRLPAGNGSRRRRPRGSSGPSDPDSVVAPDGFPWMEPAAAPSPKVSRRDPKVPPWPGRIPEPSPAIVHHEPVNADVRDAGGMSVSVNGRGMLSAEPSWLRVNGDWARIVAWAGPWPVDERWWDPKVRQRLARLQVTTQKDLAYLLKLTDGRWWVEATYD
jgi:protein ImuB